MGFTEFRAVTPFRFLKSAFTDYVICQTVSVVFPKYQVSEKMNRVISSSD